MSHADNGTEYIFIDNQGSEHFEIVFERSDAAAFAKLHGAKTYMPLATWERLKPTRDLHRRQAAKRAARASA